MLIGLLLLAFVVATVARPSTIDDSRLSTVSNIAALRRLRRQSLVVQNLGIHSRDSNITIRGHDADATTREAIVDFDRPPFNATLYARRTHTTFDASAAALHLDADDCEIGLLFRNVVFRGAAARGNLKMGFNTTTADQNDDKTTIGVRLDDEARFGIADSLGPLRVLSAGATRVSMSASVDSKETGRDRAFELDFDHKAAAMRVRFVDGIARADVEIQRAIIQLGFGSLLVQVDAAFRRLVVLTPAHRYEVHSLGRPFDARIDNTTNTLSLGFPDDRVRLVMGYESDDADARVTIDVPAKLDVQRSNDSIVRIGESIANLTIDDSATTFDHVTLVARRLELRVATTDNAPIVEARAEESCLTVNTTIAQMSLKANEQLVQIEGASPLLVATTEHLAIVVRAHESPLVLPDIAFPTFDYASLGLGNLTALDSAADRWFTSRVDLNALVGGGLEPIADFSTPLSESMHVTTTTSREQPTIETTTVMSEPIDDHQDHQSESSTADETEPDSSTVVVDSSPTPDSTPQIAGTSVAPTISVNSAANEDPTIHDSTDESTAATAADFLIQQYETPPADSRFPLSATIVNLALVPTPPPSAVVSAAT